MRAKVKFAIKNAVCQESLVTEFRVLGGDLTLARMNEPALTAATTLTLGSETTVPGTQWVNRAAVCEDTGARATSHE